MVLRKLNCSSSSLKLNTKDCCFICLKCIRQDKQRQSSRRNEHDNFSLSVLFRYLNINVTDAISEAPTTSQLQFGRERCEITAGLCEDCSKLNGGVQKLVRDIEMTRMKIGQHLNSIREKMKDAGRTPSRMLRYHRRMTSDTTCASSLKSIEQLRSRISTKCNDILLQYQPTVSVARLNTSFEIGSDNSVSDEELSAPPNFDFGADTDGTIAGFSCEAEQSMEVTSNVQLFSEDQKVFSFEEIETSEVTLAAVICKTEREESINDSDTELANKVKGNGHRKGRGPKKRMHKKVGKFKCGLCSKTFLSNIKANAHRNTVHYKTRFHCDVPGCEKAFAAQQGLKMHQTSEHPKGRNRSEKKPSSPSIQNSKEDLLEKSSPGNSSFPKVSTKKDEYYCKICQKKFRNPSKLNEHQKQVHLKIRDFKCDHCDKKFFRIKEMRRHRDAVHYLRRFRCNILGCNADYGSVDRFRNHRKLAHPETVVPKDPESQSTHCKLCNKTYASPTNLREHHLNVHLKVRRFECDICGRKFAKVKDGKRHRDSVHLGIRHFCKFPGCKRDYSDTTQLKDHQKTAHCGWLPPKSPRNPKNASSTSDKIITESSIKQELV